MGANEVGLRDARAKLGELVARAQHADQVTYLTRHGQRVAAIAPVPAEGAAPAKPISIAGASDRKENRTMNQGVQVQALLTNALKLVEIASTASTDPTYQAKVEDFRAFFL